MWFRFQQFEEREEAQRERDGDVQYELTEEEILRRERSVSRVGPAGFLVAFALLAMPIFLTLYFGDRLWDVITDPSYDESTRNWARLTLGGIISFWTGSVVLAGLVSFFTLKR